MIDSISLPPNKQEYYVYLIQGLMTDVTKIGISNSPKRRLKELQRHSPDTLYICATLTCENQRQAHRIERELHNQFYVERYHYEWFDIPALHIIERSGLPFTWHHFERVASLLTSPLEDAVLIEPPPIPDNYIPPTKRLLFWMCVLACIGATITATGLILAILQQGYSLVELFRMLMAFTLTVSAVMYYDMTEALRKEFSEVQS